MNKATIFLIKCYFYLISILIPFGMSAGSNWDFNYNGIYYKINSDKASVCVTYYSSGGDTPEYYNMYKYYQGNIVIPDSAKDLDKTYPITEIREYAFANCAQLTSITYGDNIKKIGKYAFYRCKKLKQFSICASVVSIEDNTFDGCDSLSNIIFHDNLDYVSGTAFNNTPWLEAQPDGVVYAGPVAYKYKGTMPSNANIVFKEGTRVIRTSLFNGHETSSNGRKIRTVTFPSTLRKISSSAFFQCINLVSVNFNEGLQEIGSDAFRLCTHLETINFLPKSLRVLGNSAFSDCTSLRAGIEIPNNVTTCEAYTFLRCESITTLSLGTNVRTIKAKAFSCKNLVRIKSFATTPPSCVSTAFGSATDKDVLDYTLCKLLVPKGTRDAYATSLVWKDFRQIEEMDILAQSLTLSPKELTLAEEQSDFISAIITPSNVDSRTLFWKSTNPLVVAVDENGKVTGIKPGVAQVIATTMDGSNLSDTCTVTVVTGKAQSITVSPTSAQLEIGGMTRLTATILPEDVTNKTVQWTSSNEEIAMVSSTGMVYAVGPGSVTITASTTDGSNLSATCQVTVDAPFSLSAQSVAVPVNTKRNIPIIVDNHVDVKSFKFTVHVPDSIEFYSNALPGPRCSDFNVTTTFNADSTVVQVSGVMTTLPLASGTGAFVLLPIKSSKYIADFDARLTDIRFTGTNDNVGTQQLPDITVTLRVLNLGDVNGDKIVDVSDINALINYMLGKPMTGTFNFNLGDLDENGIIDISDINAVINLMLGKY